MGTPKTVLQCLAVAVMVVKAMVEVETEVMVVVGKNIRAFALKCLTHSFFLPALMVACDNSEIAILV